MTLDLDHHIHKDHQLTRGLRCKLMVTIGVTLAVAMLEYGLHSQALWASFAANMIWIWEGA